MRASQVEDQHPAETAVARRIPRALLLPAFALSGAAALTYEVVWTRALSVILGSTTYALSSMLATFMLGLAIGGFLGGRLADRRGGPLLWLGIAELGIGLLGISSHLVIEALPAVYLAAYRTFHLSGPAYFAAQIILCSAVMFLPTVLMGMTFPLVTRAVVGGMEDLGRSVGVAYGANTLGSVCGALLAGFALVPGVGLRGATLVAAGANALVGGGILLARGRGRRERAALLLLLAYVPLAGWALVAERGWRLVNFYTAASHVQGPGYDALVQRDRALMVKLFEWEGADGYVAAFRDRAGYLSLQVGGKVEGTSAEDVPTTLALAWLPVAAHPDAKRTLVIGLGAGVTLEAARRVTPDVSLVEISEGVLTAVGRFGPPGVLDGIPVHRDDARHLLLRTDERWDVISSEPSYPTEFAVANLFSREYFQLAASRLSPGGVYCQWLPYYALTNDDVTMMVKTFATVFPHTSLWKVGASMDLLLLGSLTPFARDPGEVAERLRALNGGAPLGIELSRTPAQVREIAGRADVPINTDDHPRLEFAVARNFRVGDLSVLER